MVVRQGALGSCFFHASIAAVAKASPSSIQTAIRKDTKSGYRVHFLTGPDELVYREDLDYARQHNYDRSEGDWVNVLMRAYAERELRQSMIKAIEGSASIPTFAKQAALATLKQTTPLLVAYDRAVRSVVSQDGKIDQAKFRNQLAKQLISLGIPATQAATLDALMDRAGLFKAITDSVQAKGDVYGAYRSIGQGGIPISVIEAFMGTSHSSQASDSAALSINLRAVHAGGHAMVAGTVESAANIPNALPGPTGTDLPTSWFVANHAYTILDYDERNRIILIKNPWALRPSPDGVFKLSLAAFQQSFRSFTSSGQPGSR